MTARLPGISRVPASDGVMKSRRADVRLAPGGPKRAREHDARNPRAGEAARWQIILDLLDPGKRCGAWSPATFAGRPVVCAAPPNDAREEHSDAGTGWRWYGERS